MNFVPRLATRTQKNSLVAAALGTRSSAVLKANNFSRAFAGSASSLQADEGKNTTVS